jgi:hypothetical protein
MKGERTKEGDLGFVKWVIGKKCQEGGGIFGKSWRERERDVVRNPSFDPVRSDGVGWVANILRLSLKHPVGCPISGPSVQSRSSESSVNLSTFEIFFDITTV